MSKKNQYKTRLVFRMEETISNKIQPLIKIERKTRKEDIEIQVKR